jgi:polyhydroxyalkanoate synthase
MYEHMPRRDPAPAKPEVARIGAAALRDYGGDGAPAVLVPSLINPPRILDLDEQVSLAAAVARMGRRTLLLDWGKAQDRKQLSVAGHVEELLLPLLRSIGDRAAIIGYCLGGTMTIAAANLTRVERVATIAAPWNFADYPVESKAALQDMWRHSEAAAGDLGALPMEVLQAAFWSFDPARTVQKFAEFGTLDPTSLGARRFVELEEWANEGEPLPYPAAKELIESLFGEDLPGSGRWHVDGKRVGEKLRVPALHFTANHDRIAPAATAPEGETVAIASGHVGMIVGSSRARLHEGLSAFLGGSR